MRQFIVCNIDSVAQLEALLLLRANAGQVWQPEAVARRLYIQPVTAAALLRGLHERELIMLAEPEPPGETQADSAGPASNRRTRAAAGAPGSSRRTASSAECSRRNGIGDSLRRLHALGRGAWLRGPAPP